MAFFILYTDMPEESKEWINIDYTTTQQYKTIEAWKEEARKVELVLEYPQDFPHSEINQLKRLKKLDSIVKPEKGPIRKVIYSIHIFKSFNYEIEPTLFKCNRQLYFFGCNDVDLQPEYRSAK